MSRIEAALEALRTVHFPGLERDIVSLGYVTDVRENDEKIEIDIELSTNLPEAGEKIEADARAALDRAALPHELRVKVQTNRAPEGAPAPPPRLLAEIPFKIAVASGKGGVGKSTVAVNLALALARDGAKVGLLDCDIYGPSVPTMMGLEDEQPTVRDEKLSPISRYDVRTISIGYFVDRNTPVIWRGPMVDRALGQLISDVDWSGIEFLVLDLPPGTGDVQLSLAQRLSLSGAVIVTTPQDVALIDAGKGVAMFRKVGIDVLGIIENMSSFACPHCGEATDIFGSGGGKRVADSLGVGLIASIPIDPRIVVGGDAGTPIVVDAPDAPAAQAFYSAAARLKETLS